LFPIKQSKVSAVLAGQLKWNVGEIMVNEIRSGKLQERIARFKRDNIHVIAADSVSHDDLLKLVDEVRSKDDKVLWVGSAGLAEALANRLAVAKGRSSARLSRGETKPPPALVVAGSVSHVTAEQVRQLMHSG